MHLHPARFLPVSYLVKSEVSVIELHIVQGGPTAEKPDSTHLPAQEHKPLVVWGAISKGDFAFMLSHLPPNGLLMIVAVSSLEEARSLWNRLAETYTTEE